MPGSASLAIAEWFHRRQLLLNGPAVAWAARSRLLPHPDLPASPLLCLAVPRSRSENTHPVPSLDITRCQYFLLKSSKFAVALSAQVAHIPPVPLQVVLVSCTSTAAPPELSAGGLLGLTLWRSHSLAMVLADYQKPKWLRGKARGA